MEPALMGQKQSKIMSLKGKGKLFRIIEYVRFKIWQNLSVVNLCSITFSNNLNKVAQIPKKNLKTK